jgi:hypothetical protein
MNTVRWNIAVSPDLDHNEPFQLAVIGFDEIVEAFDLTVLGVGRAFTLGFEIRVH